MKRPWPFRHLGLKLLALGLGVLLWMVVSGEATVERVLRVPLELQQFPQGLELQSEAPSNVELRVRGGSGTLSRLSPADIVAVVDLHGARAGQRLFHVTPDQVRVPFGVEIVQITPSTVALVFEVSASKLVRVVPAYDGKPAPGFIVGKVTSVPETVEIVGPESAVKRAAAALTEPISVAGARETVRGTVPVGVFDSTLRLKTSRTVVVDVQILTAPLERVVHGLPVRWRNLSPNLVLRFTPVVVDISVRGTRESLNRIGADDLSAFVDVMGLGAGDYSLPVRAESARTEAGVFQIEPSKVQVRITSDKN
ncbi:MAG: CdaR family protein [Acidobacteriota bacterium]